MVTPLDEETRTAMVRLLLPDLREVLHRHPTEAGEFFEELHPADGADLLRQLEDEEVHLLLQHLDPAEAARLLEYADPAFASRHLQEQLEKDGEEKVADTLEEMDPDDRAEVLAHFEDEAQEEVLAKMEPEEREDAVEILSHPDGTAGRLMTQQFKTVFLGGNAADALEQAREGAREEWNITSLFVVDEQGVLRGKITLMDVIKADPRTEISEIMTEPLTAVRVDTDQEQVAQVISKYDLLSVPVIDFRDRIVGIVTVDDVVDVLEQEATEDVQKLGAVQPLENPYFQTGFWEMVKKRGVWLIVFFLAELLTGTLLKHHEEVLNHAISLIFFVPLILSSGGNAGSQSATLITRALAVGEVALKDALRIAGREVGMGFALGLIVGGIGFARAFILQSNALVSFAVALTLVGVVTVGTLAGAMLPLIFKRLHLDPAMASSPFVASAVDITGILLYLTIARWILGI